MKEHHTQLQFCHVLRGYFDWKLLLYGKPICIFVFWMMENMQSICYLWFSHSCVKLSHSKRTGCKMHFSYRRLISTLMFNQYCFTITLVRRASVKFRRPTEEWKNDLFLNFTSMLVHLVKDDSNLFAFMLCFIKWFLSVTL